ncbi:NACHT, LRR and PYD domains-containing protein 12 [Carassius auratus]|uniref:NACHT, LRR and PYD domains-containing protein 12 n=1 Tax=Carassius auratus TaxID=7957 RepID=A0A6P6MJN7_CARAU|nr:NACHT, LRR and PYD domains-containing protein 12-like [Carassius auratus]
MATRKNLSAETDLKTGKSLRDFPESRRLSLKSTASMCDPPMLSGKDSLVNISLTQRECPESSCLSMKSEASMGDPPEINEIDSLADVSLIQGRPPEPSCLSMKSKASMGDPPEINGTGCSVDLRNKQDESLSESNSTGQKQLDSIFKELEHKIIFLTMKELKRIKRVLSPDYSACFEREEKEEVDEGESRVRQGILQITLNVLRTKKTNLANILQTRLAPFYVKQHKSRLKDKFQRIHEGISNQGSSAPLHDIYTELYITEGGSGEVNNEHEVRQLETQSRRPESHETPIKCSDIFKPLPRQNKSIRTVLTKGVAGIGKTVSVQKFVLDWTEGKANQDLHFIFPLPFRELNLIKETNLSLINLIHHFFTQTNKLRSTNIDDFTVLFIFDGLDECRLPLDFQNNAILCDVTESASLDVLLTNLIKGNLLPSALLWITSRPAATNQIPPECVDLVTDVRGFNDPQKDEYFRKKINDHTLASKIIAHIKSSRSLYIMCHIPVFSWISATVLERLLSKSEMAEIPKTLTQMFTHFLIFQLKLKSLKYDGECDVNLKQARSNILSLGKLAFQQLEKGNLIFYEQDLRECGIDVRDASLYSGVCTQIFREEFGLYLGKVYSFVHLSIQEFLAALYVFLCFFKQTGFFSMFRSSLTDLLKCEVDKALKSENGHLDLFLRFLLGLSLESNQTLLRGLVKKARIRSRSEQEIIEYIKIKIKENSSSEKSINLFYCLKELNDDSLVQEVQIYLSTTGDSQLSGVKLSPSQWSALVFVLLTSEEKLDEFKLSKYHKSEECLQSLLPVIKASTKADLRRCNLMEKSCSALASVLSSNSSHLNDLNLSYNNLLDSGVKLLSAGLMNHQCKLKTLQLEYCSIGEKGCSALASALRSNPSHLKELNLNYNKLGDTGVRILSDLLQNPHCKLEKMLLCNCSFGEEGCSVLALALRSNPSHLRELDLNDNYPGQSGINQISDLLQYPLCKLKKLGMCNCRIGEEGCAALTSALKSNPSHLRELDLSYNNLGDSGVKLLSDLLRDPHCKLDTLQLNNCSFGEEGCSSLASALRSNPSHLKELDLGCNKLRDSGAKLLANLLEDPQCKLKKLLLENSSIGEEGCASLSSALKLNPSHLRELDLGNNYLGVLGVKVLSHLLRDPECKLEILQLYNCRIEEKGCARLASALRSNPSHLRELNLSCNKPSVSELKLFCNLAQDPHNKLEKLDLSVLY